MEDSVFATVLLPAALAVIMISLGTSLTVADFRRVVTQPKGISIGLLNLVLISPFLAFGIAELYGLDPALAVGLVLLGAAPGGTMANLLTHLARGDTALSVSLTGISSVAAVITVPLFLELSTGHFDAPGLNENIGMLGIVARVLAITAIPLGVGMWLRARRSGWVEAHGGLLKRASLVTFGAVIVGVVIGEHARVLENLDAVAAAAITLNIAAMAISYSIARIARLDERQATAIAIELGVHNATLAIAVGATIATVLTIPAAVYASFMFATAGAFAKLMHSRNSRLEQAA
jgi:BASS family bile acid:Na+ symporter